MTELQNKYFPVIAATFKMMLSVIPRTKAITVDGSYCKYDKGWNFTTLTVTDTDFFMIV